MESNYPVERRGAEELSKGGRRPTCYRRSESQYQSFMKEFYAYTQRSSVHGLSEIINRQISSIRRTIWTIIIMGGLASLIFVSANSFGSFLSFNVKTTIKDVYTDEIVFPAVTVCNINRYRKSQINGTDFEKWLLGTYSIVNKFFDQDSLADPELVANLNRTEFMLQASHQKESMITRCMWNSYDYCGPENFTTVFTDYGVCYTFNSDVDNPLVVKRTGPKSGLQVYLYIEKDEYTFGSLEPSVGIKVSIHPQDEPSLISFRALSAPKQSSAFIGIEKSEIRSKAAPYSSDCQSGGIRFSERYSYYGCLAQGLSDAILDQCGCKEPYMIHIDAPVCNFNQSLCAEKLFDSHRVKCRTPCKRVLYTPEISYAAFPSEHVISDLTVIFNKTADQLRDNYVALSVYYKELVYQLTEETPEYTLDDLIGNIGGILGFCLGASVLTLYEIFEFLFISILNSIKRAKKLAPA